MRKEKDDEIKPYRSGASWGIFPEIKPYPEGALTVLSPHFLRSIFTCHKNLQQQIPYPFFDPACVRYKLGPSRPKTLTNRLRGGGG